VESRGYISTCTLEFANPDYIERLKLGFRLLYFTDSDYIEFSIYLAYEDPLLIGTVLVHVFYSRSRVNVLK
jgi:hypothetical protein